MRVSGLRNAVNHGIRPLTVNVLNNMYARLNVNNAKVTRLQILWSNSLLALYMLRVDLHDSDTYHLLYSTFIYCR